MLVLTPARRTRLARLGAAALLATTLTTLTVGCSTDQVGTVEAAAKSTDADRLTVSDAWVKAGSGMTGAFALLSNDGDQALRLESVSTDVAGKVELHETVSDGAGGMTMRPKEGGFAVEAGGRHALAPGGDHIMLMDLARSLVPGEEVRLVLHLSDGSTRTVSALVKDFTGADEKYSGSEESPSESPSGMHDTAESGSDGS
jgi:copper(I)-binding protein